MAAPLRNSLLLKSFPNISISLTRTFQSSCTCGSAASEQQNTRGKRPIQIPKKIKRDELSVLRALESTVDKNYEGPHYKYMDDPFLIPTSALEKRSFSLAKASGVKAAKYVLQQYPDLLEKPVMYDYNVPYPQAYMPDAGPKHSDTTLLGLQERIDRRSPSLAYESYQKLQEAGTEIPLSVQNDLLALLCTYNSDDAPQDPEPEELFYGKELGGGAGDIANRLKKTWKDSGPAEQLFKTMETKDSTSYSYMVRGRAKYFQVDKAFELYREMKKTGHQVDITTYNAILSIGSFLKDGPEVRWELIKEMVAEMHSNNVCPNLETFNNILKVLTRASKHKDVRKWIMEVINEMKHCNIEPSLKTWQYVLRIFYNDEYSNSGILRDIINHLEGKEFEYQQPEDLEFFSMAMSKCCVNLQDLELGYKIDRLLNTGKNVYLVGDGIKEGVYFTYFIKLLCMFEQIDTVMEHYSRVTPHSYTPTFGVFDEILRAIDLNDGYQYLPQIWSDFTLFAYARRTDLVEHMLSIMAKKKQNEQLQDLFHNVATQVLNKYEEDSQNFRINRPLQLTGPMVGDLAQIMLHCDQFGSAWKILEIYRSKKREINGFPSESSLTNLAEKCIELKDAERAIQILEVMSDFAYPKMDVVAADIKKAFILTDTQKQRIDDVL